MAEEKERQDKPGDKEELLELSREQFKHAFDVWKAQRQREAEDLRFQVPELQWDEAARAQRLGKTGDTGFPLPARPILSISKLDQPIQIVINQERAAKLGVSIQPVSPEADDETATILEGIYRRIERDSNAHVARSWAFDRAVKAGLGYYRIITKWDDYSDNPSDQVICIERILHQDSVYFDPAAQKADFSDAEFVFITSWMPIDAFEREFPKAKTPTDSEEFAEMIRDAPEWVKDDGPRKAVLVAEKFWKVHNRKKRNVGKDFEREYDEVTVKWAKMTAFEILEERDWSGKHLPVVAVIGRELQPFDSERRWVGVIGPAKDGQRLYNYAASTAVEIAALEPKAPYIGAEGQFEGHETEWLQANIRNFPYLEYKPTMLNGELAPMPQRAQADVGKLGPSMQLLQQADQFIQTTTATYDPSLGRTSAREKSGRAILALQQQGDAGNSHYMHNLSDISMTYEARVILDLIPAVYDRQERLVQILTEEGESKPVMLNQRFYSGPNGRPMPLQDGQRPPVPSPVPQMGAPRPGMPPGPAASPQPPPVKNYDLRKGTYSVAISIGKQRQTALQEAADEIGQILQAQPQLMPIIGPIYFKNRDFPGAKELADLMLKVRNQNMPFLAEQEGSEAPTLEQAMAKAQALEGQMKQMGQVMDQMKQAIDTDQAKQRAEIIKAQMDAQTALQKAEMDNRTKIAVEQIKAEAEQRNTALLAEMKRMMEAMKLGHESEENAKDRVHDTEQQMVGAVLAPIDLNFKGASDVPLPVEEEI